MKRTGFASAKKFSSFCRKAPPVPSDIPRVKPLASLLRTTRLPQTTKPLRARRKAVPAVELAYLKRVAALPCACCDVWGYSQAAHSNRYEDGKGRGIKSHYTKTFPLCCARPGITGCHIAHDQCIGMTREEADARTPLYIADTQRKLGVGQ